MNTASKVERFKEESVRSEEQLRREVLREAVDSGVQLLQLPCPEFVMYGSLRWGHTYEQFDNTFYRSRCRELLEPVVQQLKEYMADKERFRILGILGMAAPAAESGIPAGASGAENLEEEIWSRF